MDRKEIRRKIFFLTIAFLSFVLQMMLWRGFLSPDSLAGVSVLNDGWDVSYNDAEYENVKLSALRGIIGDSCHRGDRIVLKREIWDLSIYDPPAMMFETRFSAWRVTCGNKVIEEHYFDAYENGKFIGCENNYVPLPSSNLPVTLEIELLVAEEGAYNFFEAPTFGSYMNVLLHSVYSNLFVLMISAFLIIFGLMFFVISLGFRSNLSEMNMQMYSSILFIVLGIWFLSQFKILDIIMETGGHQTEIEYISLYILVPLMYLVLGNMQSYFQKKWFVIIASIGSFIPFILIFIHFMGIARIHQMLVIYQIDALIMCVYILVLLLIDTREKNISNSQLIQLIGETMLALSFLFNVLFYYLEVAGVSEQIMLSKKAVPMGTMCMVFASLVNYHIYIADTLARKKEQESLAHLAYADGLTGIPNRSSYEKYLDDLHDEGNDYCVISIDLNGLKTVNDKLGHQMGDKYLSEFSDAFERCFNEKGFIARIGGDEFVGILNGENLNNAGELIEKLTDVLEGLNYHDNSFMRSAAMGYAFRHEVPGRDWKYVYLLADERMYRNKAKMK